MKSPKRKAADRLKRRKKREHERKKTIVKRMGEELKTELNKAAAEKPDGKITWAEVQAIARAWLRFHKDERALIEPRMMAANIMLSYIKQVNQKAIDEALAKAVKEDLEADPENKS